MWEQYWELFSISSCFVKDDVCETSNGICEKVSMSLWTLLVGILGSSKILVVALCMVPLILVVMIIGGRTIHPC